MRSCPQAQVGEQTHIKSQTRKRSMVGRKKGENKAKSELFSKRILKKNIAPVFERQSSAQTDKTLRFCGLVSSYYPITIDSDR
jgi:hypothetical protein